MFSRPFVRALTIVITVCAIGGVFRLSRTHAADGQVVTRPGDSRLRVLVWNVAGVRLLKQSAGFKEIFQLISPDVLMLDEVPPEAGERDIREVLPGRSSTWSLVIGSAGGRQRAVIAARNAQMTRIVDFDHLDYDPATVAKWLSGLPTGLPRQRLEDEARVGIPSAGAMLHLGELKLVVVGIDLQCCGDEPSSWQEDRRRVEASMVGAAVDRVFKTTGANAVIVAGDVNPVTGDRPLDLLKSRASHIGTLTLAAPRHLDGVTTWTWDGRGTQFSSKALDYLLFSRELRLVNAFIFDSETAPASVMQSSGISRTRSMELSDHRPIVVDLAWTVAPR